MGSIRITRFGGMRPRDSRNTMKEGKASLARDTKLWHGTVASWRYPSLEIETNKKICALYKYNCCFITSDNPCASFARGDTDCNRVFATGVKPWPAYTTLPDCDCCGELPVIGWKRLGVPAPEQAPIFTDIPTLTPPSPTNMLDAGDQVKREPRGYFYTYVNDYGEESNPSPVSEIVDMDFNATPTFIIPYAPLEDGYFVHSIRIYRGSPYANHTITDGQGIDAQAQSGFYFVDQIPYVTYDYTYTDSLNPTLIGELWIEEQCNDVPLENLEGIKMIHSGSLVAFEGKNLWFTEPFKFHSWSCHMNFDHCIEGIEVLGDDIYVITNGNPYVVNGVRTDETCMCCRSVVRINESAPLASRQSLVSTPAGVIWATHTGLVRLNSGTFDYITLGHYGEDQWGYWAPHRLRGAYYKGQYFGFNDQKGFIFDLREGIYNDRYDGEESSFTELSLTPDAFFVSDQNEFYMSFNGGIHRWDNSDTLMPYKWRSQLNVEGGNSNLSIAKIVFQDWINRLPVPYPVMFRLYCDDRLVFERMVHNSQPFRLPKGYKGLNWEIEIEGVQEVMEIHLATSMRELTLMSNT